MRHATGRCALTHITTPGSEPAQTRAHTKEDEATETYSCEACAAKFKSKEELHGHMQREHAQQPSEKTAPGQEKKKEQGH
jgi:hypothetical protein